MPKNRNTALRAVPRRGFQSLLAHGVLASTVLTLTVLAFPALAQDDRIEFKVQLSDGSFLEGSAGDLEQQPKLYVLASGRVKLKHREMSLEADRARVDIPTNLLTAEGDVILDEGPRRLTGTTLEWDLQTETGRVTNGMAFVDPAYYFSGDEIAKIGDSDYRIDNGVFTSCDQDVPSWSMALDDATITVGGYARIKNARFKLKRLPVLYFPYVVWPAKAERTSGLLIPNVGQSRRRGGYLGLAYFQTLGRSADATFFLDLFTKEYLGLGAEFRYRPSETSSGALQAYWLQEPDFVEQAFAPEGAPLVPGRERWKVNYYHESEKVFDRFRGVVSIEQYSDFDYLLEFERNANNRRKSFIYSNAYLSGNFGQHSLNFLTDQRELRGRDGSETTRRQLPEVEYRLRPMRLGSSQLYFGLGSSLSYFSLSDDDPTTESLSYGRVDLAPELSMPVSNLSWLSAKVTLGGRATYYTKSLTPSDILTPDATDGLFDGGSLSRTFGQATLEAIGPRFSRIFEKSAGRFGKFKHIVEPQVTYVYTSDFDDQGRVFLFDEVDDLFSGQGYVVKLANRLLAKPTNEEEGGAFEIASFELSQPFTLEDIDDPETLPAETVGALRSSKGPISALLRFNPGPDSSLKVEAIYSPLASRLRSFSLSTGTSIGRHKLGVTWRQRWNLVTGNESQNQMGLFTKFTLIPDRLTFETAHNYDFLRVKLDDLGQQVGEGRFLDQRYFVRWQSACYSLALEVTDALLLSTGLRDREYRFSFTLKNVGTFLDLSGGIDSI